MQTSGEKGDLIEWFLMLLALSVVIFAILIPPSKRTWLTGFPPSLSVGQTGVTGTPSPSFGSSSALSIGLGNARTSYQPYEEYITITNRGSAAVDLTGWSVSGSKSGSATITQGARVFSPSGSAIGDIILGQNETALLVTGKPGSISPYQLVSFKENSCTRYLSEYYPFPYMEKGCVRASAEPGEQALDSDCRDYLDTLRSCHKPQIGGHNSQGESCDDCADGKQLSSSCTAFVASHFNYTGCLANHQNDRDFEGSVWHVYLYKTWEMWAADHDTITLFDRSGRVVAQTSY